MNILKTKLSTLIPIFIIFAFTLIPFQNANFLLADDTVSDLNEELSDNKVEIDKLEGQVSSLEEEIQKKQEEEQNLKNQIDILDNEIEKAEIEIEEAELKIEMTTQEIFYKKEEINAKEAEIEKQKLVLAEFIKIMYQYDQKSPIELILGYNSFSDYLDDLQYLETLQNKGSEILESIKDLKEELNWEKQVLEAKQESLEKLATKLENTRSILDQEKEGRQRLLEETEAQEEKYQELLTKARDEQESINEEITNLEREIRKQLQSRKSVNTDFDWQNIAGDGTLAWPVNPSRGISAYFMDPSYYNYFGINHYAIDIPTPQGTPLHAPADGYVVRYRDAGYGYSYIVLLHAGDISTVYGHASASFLPEGTLVKKGDIIGLTGGTPGTWGAGLMTTGAHLHLEVRVNGVPVNPLNYLPGL